MERDRLEGEAGGHHRHRGHERLPPSPRNPSDGTPTRRTPHPSAPMPPATGGRLGPNRTTSSRDQTTRTGQPLLSASRRASGSLASGASPRRPHRSRQADAGSPPGVHHEASGSTYAGSTQVVRRVSFQSPGRQGDRMVQPQAAPPPLHLAGQGPGRSNRFGQGIVTGTVGHRGQGAGRTGIVGESGPAEDRGRYRPPGAPRPRGRRGRRRDAGHAGRGLPHPGRPSGERPGQRLLRWSATRCTGTGGPAGPGRLAPPRVDAAGPTGPAEPRGPAGPIPGRRSWARAASLIDDARGAEAALAGAGGHKGRHPPFPLGLRQTVERGDLAALEPPDRRHTRHPGGTVHPDRAAPALALGAAAVLDRADVQLVAEDLEQRRSVVGHLDVGAVDAELDITGSAAQLKEEPQPQVREALGLVTWNPAPWSPSL